jgi:hypothetical protein
MDAWLQADASETGGILTSQYISSLRDTFRCAS